MAAPSKVAPGGAEGPFQGRDDFWRVSAPEMMRSLATPEVGLSAPEAARRLAQAGPNSVRARKKASALLLFLAQFKSPIILMLVFAALVSLYFQSYIDASIILGIVFLSGLLGFYQEFSASGALEKLLQVVKVTTTVLREGTETAVPTEEVVPGDVVILSAGSLIPADCLLLEADDLYVEEAILSGETLPVRKEPGVVEADHPSVAQMTNVLFMGTHVRSGKARALVVRTGASSQFGRIAERLKLRPPRTEFEDGVAHFGFFLLEVTLVLVLLIFASNVFLKKPVLDSLLFSLALAVGLAPQLLPAIITINLAKGARAMARRKVIVKRLPAIENFGSMEVLCTDKTGTLTEGRVRLEAYYNWQGQADERVLLYACLNSSLETGIRNPIDQAILDYRQLDLSGYQKVDEIPYDFSRKRLSIVAKDASGAVTLITKGAFPSVLAACDSLEAAGTRLPLAPQRAALEELHRSWSAQGLRVLGVACRQVEERPNYEPEDEAGMSFLGFLLFLDPPKADARETLERLRSLGIVVKVVTGDNHLVAGYVARQVGLAGRILTGREMEGMLDAALIRSAKDIDIFAEVDPNQKERIVRALRKAGYVTGFMGDGINDAPALHAADVSISVQDGVDVAKEAADIVLLEGGLETLAEGVMGGRQTFANTMKYVFMATSANFGNMFSVAGASLFLPFLPMVPKQILLTNFLTDFPELTIATDNVDPEMMERPRRWDIHYIRRFMLYFGLLSSIFDYATFGVLLLVLRADPVLFRTGWFVESVLSASFVVLVIRTRRPFFQSRPSPYLALATVLVAAVVVVLPYTGPLAAIFGLRPLPAFFWLSMAGILLAYGVVAEGLKRRFYRPARVSARRPSFRPIG